MIKSILRHTLARSYATGIATSVLHPTLKTALMSGLKFDSLLEIQDMVLENLQTNYIPSKEVHIPDAKSIMISRTPVLIAAETGSGKTLAYLLPLFHNLKTEEELLASSELNSSLSENENSWIENDPIFQGMLNGTINFSESLKTIDQTEKENRISLINTILRPLRSPRAIIIVPTRDLVSQVLSLAKTLSHFCKLHVVGITSDTTIDRISNELSSPVDVLISSPRGITRLYEHNEITLKNTKTLIVDEADTLVDRNQSGDELEKVLRLVKQAENDRETQIENNSELNKTKLIFVSATIPKVVSKQLLKIYPNLQTITTENLHRPKAQSKHNFQYLDGSKTKTAILIEILRREIISLENATSDSKYIRSDPRVIVFCNTKASAKSVFQEIHQSGFKDAICVTSDMEEKERKRAFNLFRQEKLDGIKLPIIISTDVASRGIDTTLCTHVILFDFPQTRTDYLHRAGRTARYGRIGKVTSLVNKKEHKWAKEMEMDMKNSGYLVPKDKEWRDELELEKKKENTNEMEKKDGNILKEDINSLIISRRNQKDNQKVIQTRETITTIENLSQRSKGTKKIEKKSKVTRIENFDGESEMEFVKGVWRNKKRIENDNVKEKRLIDDPERMSRFEKSNFSVSRHDLDSEAKSIRESGSDNTKYNKRLNNKRYEPIPDRLQHSSEQSRYSSKNVSNVTGKKLERRKMTESWDRVGKANESAKKWIKPAHFQKQRRTTTAQRITRNSKPIDPERKRPRAKIIVTGRKSGLSESKRGSKKGSMKGSKFNGKKIKRIGKSKK
ncbi:hypothetical protein HK096_000198 [Nowakowskiella sp. JEL0078]|nr:hypothetical protein HK096_000198 [Nowakowskiella sp. JEL0078]